MILSTRCLVVTFLLVVTVTLVVSLLATVIGAGAAIELVASSTIIGLAVRLTVQGILLVLFCGLCQRRAAAFAFFGRYHGTYSTTKNDNAKNGATISLSVLRDVIMASYHKDLFTTKIKH